MKRFTILALVVSAAALCLSIIGFITVSRQVQEMQALAKRTEQAAEQTQAQLAESQESQSAAIAAVQLTTENQGKQLDGLAEQVRKLSEQPAKDIQYVMFLGTNDKDTNEPVFTPDDAKAQADTILSRYFSGFTIQEARGGWTNDDGTVSHEYTVVILLSDTTPEAVHAAANELIDVFHQSAVLIQANETTTEFYVGAAQ